MYFKVRLSVDLKYKSNIAYLKIRLLEVYF